MHHDHLEMGATWFGFKHEHLKNLLDELKLDYFKQFQEGESTLVFNSMSPPHHFQADTSAPPSYRIANGSEALIKSLAKPFNDKIQLNQLVKETTDCGDHIEITTHNSVFKANNVLFTIPPRLAAARILFNPELDNEIKSAMQTTPTWMEQAIKFVLTFKKPFWREAGKSGMLISQIAPVVEVYDHINYSNDQFALMGFVNPKLKEYSTRERKEQVITYLCRYLGEGVSDYLEYKEKDWSLDPFTAVQASGENMQPNYGNSIFAKPYMNDKLFFIGTETSSVFGGYMEGAVYSGKQTAAKIIANMDS